MLIDPQGKIWSADGETVRRLFDSDLPRQVVIRYAVRNMGWMFVRCTAGEAVINCRPGRISDVAVAAAAYALTDNEITRARIGALDDNNLVHGLAHVIAALERLQASPAPAIPRLLHKSVGLSSTPFVDVQAEIAKSGILSLELDALRRACDHMFGGRYTIATAAGPDRPVCIVGIGTRYTHFSRTFYDRAVGLRFEDGPDVKYGKWVSETMGKALDTLVPSWGEVDAEVRYANRPLRIRYDRMIVPFANERGERFVLSTSSMRDSIDLRTGCGQP